MMDPAQTLASVERNARLFVGALIKQLGIAGQ
jgi:hypothetical protein